MMSRFRQKSIVAGLAGLSIMLGACAEVGDPYLGAAPGDGPAQVIAIDDEPATAEGTLSTASTLPLFIPERPEGYVPDLLVSSPDGVGVARDGAIVPLVFPSATLAARAAFDDFFGGVVVEDETGDVLWFAEQADAGVVINEPGDALLDVGFIDASAEALLSSSPQTIDRLSLVSGARSELISFAETESVLDVSSGGGLYVVALANETCGELRFLNGAGEPVTLAGPQVGDCPVLKQPSFTHVATTPSGDFYAYTQVSYRSDGVADLTEAVIADTATGNTIRIPIAGAGETITSFSFEGNRIGFVRETLRPNEVVVIDIAKADQPNVIVAPGVSTVSFARIPLRVGGLDE